MKKDILKKIIEMKNVEDRKNYIETLKIMIYTGINLSESEIEIIESHINDEKELKKRYLDLVVSEELNSDTEPPVEDDELDKLMNDDDDSDDSADSVDSDDSADSADSANDNSANDNSDDELDKLMNDDDDDNDIADDTSDNDNVDDDDDKDNVDDDAGDDNDNDDADDDSDEIEMSKEGVGILPLIAEIQKRLSNGKPSPVEIAALKALKKLLPK
jgi:hypothetical protein